MFDLQVPAVLAAFTGLVALIGAGLLASREPALPRVGELLAVATASLG